MDLRKSYVATEDSSSCTTTQHNKEVDPTAFLPHEQAAFVLLAKRNIRLLADNLIERHRTIDIAQALE